MKYVFISILFFFSCINKPVSVQQKPIPTITLADNSLQGNYWYQGLGEVNTYELEQVRYGQIHKGEAVVIFVTEDFNKAKQVKSDHPDSAGSDRQSMFKMNMIKQFNTGIYKYSLMLSVFNPIGPEVTMFPLKTTCTVQDWCGQVFGQLNQKDNLFKIRNFSYFESEGDSIKELPTGYTEDGFWNQIRINPNKLPIGDQKVLSSFFYARLKHRPQDYYRANLGWSPINDSLSRYTIDYVDENRILKINFRTNYPYQIVSWTETYKDGDHELTTKANLKKSILIDYWTKHNVEDLHYRKDLGLDQ